MTPRTRSSGEERREEGFGGLMRGAVFATTASPAYRVVEAARSG